mgnify:CR=1 FL=1
MKKLIQVFLEKFCVKVADNEDSATTELYMDNHDCIEFEDMEYYVPKDNSFYSEDDELTREMLVATFSL